MFNVGLVPSPCQCARASTVTCIATIDARGSVRRGCAPWAHGGYNLVRQPEQQSGGLFWLRKCAAAINRTPCADDQPVARMMFSGLRARGVHRLWQHAAQHLLPPPRPHSTCTLVWMLWLLTAHYSTQPGKVSCLHAAERMPCMAVMLHGPGHTASESGTGL